MTFTVSCVIQSRSPGIGDIVLKRMEGCSLSIIVDTLFMSRAARFRPPVQYNSIQYSIVVQLCAVSYSVV